MKIKVIAVILIVCSILYACSKNSLDVNKSKETTESVQETKTVSGIGNQNIGAESESREEGDRAGFDEPEVVNAIEFGNPTFFLI